MGHANTYIAFDLLIRAWLDSGIAVEYVQNVTDIDEPLLERAVATGQDWRAVADRETALFREDMQALGVIAPQHYIGAVESIPQDLCLGRRYLFQDREFPAVRLHLAPFAKRDAGNIW